MRNTITGARVYRFHDTVAINLKVADRFTETFYIPAAVAFDIGLLFSAAEFDINQKSPKFSESEFGTHVVTADENKPWPSRTERE